MTDDIKTYLKRRRAQVAASIAFEKKTEGGAQRQVKQSRANIADLKVRLSEIDHQMQELGVDNDEENVILMRRDKTETGNQPGARTRPDLRYRHPGPTTDIVAMAYQCVGMEIDALADKAQALHKAKGIGRKTIMKLIRRMIHEGYAYREGTRFFLTPLCKKAWESSPLFRKSAANA